jgi:hypothetical protein
VGVDRHRGDRRLTCINHRVGRRDARHRLRHAATARWVHIAACRRRPKQNAPCPGNICESSVVVSSEWTALSIRRRQKPSQWAGELSSGRTLAASRRSRPECRLPQSLVSDHVLPACVLIAQLQQLLDISQNTCAKSLERPGNARLPLAACLAPWTMTSRWSCRCRCATFSCSRTGLGVGSRSRFDSHHLCAARISKENNRCSHCTSLFVSSRCYLAPLF